jgi:hypothetical protein
MLRFDATKRLQLYCIIRQHGRWTTRAAGYSRTTVVGTCSAFIWPLPRRDKLSRMSDPEMQAAFDSAYAEAFGVTYSEVPPRATTRVAGADTSGHGDVLARLLQESVRGAAAARSGSERRISSASPAQSLGCAPTTAIVATSPARPAGMC